MKQSQALKILQSGANVFLTGSAGSGKTFILNKFIDDCRAKNIKVGITASTGIAATHIGGRTIHSWCGMGIEESLNAKDIKRLLMNEELFERLRTSSVLVIDEISMLDASRFELVEKICRSAKNPFEPFGGIQIVLCGDFFQLPPISRTGRRQFAFESAAWAETDLKICYLEEQFRQDDPVFLKILNKIRNSEANEAELELLKSRLFKTVPYAAKPTKLYSHNTNVDAINEEELSRIFKDERVYEMKAIGTKKAVDFLKKSYPAPEELRLKVGAMVMFIKNNFEAGYVNGTLGEVVDFDEDDNPIVKTKKHQRLMVSRASWNLEENDLVVATIKQIPLRLAWAITIHKSQGMSLDAAEIDLSRTFERGMGYVALSRVRSLDGIRLMGINDLALKVDELVAEKDKEFRRLSAATAKISKKWPKNKISSKQVGWQAV